jgi:hypothetical protein
MATLATTDSTALSATPRGYSDSIASRDQVTVFLPALAINVSERVSTFDIQAPPGGILSWGGFGGAWFGASYFADAPNAYSLSKDTVSTSGTSFISLSDAPVVLESIFSVIPAADFYYIVVSELASLAEAPRALIPSLLLAKSDTVSLTEAINRFMAQSILASDLVSVTPSLLTGLTINAAVTDQLLVSEEWAALLEFLGIAVTANVDTTEAVSLVLLSHKKSRLSLLGVG